jgi:hypothetical protein
MEFYSYLWLREDGTPRYVGKGSGKRAYIRHGKFYPPIDKSRIVVFPAAAESEAFAAEKVFIDLFGRKDVGLGCLHNRTDGGDGVSGMCHSEDAKKRISRALLGHKTKGMTGRHHSEETKQKMSLSSKGQIPWVKGKTWSEASRQKLSISATGRKMSAEAIEKMAAAKRGIPHTAEHRAKISAANKGKKRGPYRKKGTL